MAVYSSGSIRFNGLGNDTNFDEMIEKLYKIESRQVTQLMRWKNDWQTRLDAFKELRGELMNLQSALTKLNSMSKFMAKTAVSSDDKVASAVAGANSVDGAYNVVVDNLAKAYSWSQNTGLYHKSDIICTEDGGGSFSYTYKGITRTISIPKNTTAEGLVKLINNDSKNPGARAQLIQTGDGITFQMYGKDTGKSNTLVIRDTSNLLLNTSLSGGNYYEEESLVQLQTGFSGAGDIINSGTENKTFIYTVDGQRYSVTVTPNMTLGELTDEVNDRHTGLSFDLASLEPNINDPTDPQVYFTLNRPDTHYYFAGDSNFNDLVGSSATNQFSDINANINTTGAAYDVSVLVSNSDNGEQFTKNITVKENMTLMEFKNALQLSLGNSATVSLVQDSGTNQWYVGMQYNPTVHRVAVEDGSLEEFAYQIPTDAQWSIIEGENARLKVNGWPGGTDDTIWMESASNTIAAGTIVEDISFTLLKTGETTITTGTDTAKIRENIEAFVDAVNSYRTVLKSLTTVDTEKSTVDPTYANSQFEMQKGAVLTGNYGVQTIESRLKSAIAGTAIGFAPRMYEADGTFLSGDIFSSLSQIGIKTNAQEGSTFFGLLEINYISGDRGSKSLDEALAEDPMAVARLFAANNEGFTDSDDFGYGSQISGTTKAGNYTVKYTCTEDGKIDKAWINGEVANINNDTLQITSVSGASKGLVIDVYPHSLVAGQAGAANEITGTVSLREGKVNELLSMLNGTEGFLGTSGTLQTLEKNYQKIIDNIEGKITREDERLARWERTMINKFARLDAVLANYNAINEGLQSQIASLNSSAKSSS